MRLISWVLVALLGGFALYKSTACELGHGCTELGCGDGVFVSAAFADHRWPAGTYELEVTLDDATHVCSFGWPENPPARGGVDDAGCELNGLRMHVSQDFECTEQRTATAVTQSCQPLEGQFHL
jgi:hypothetical protein